jgi:hypothetical protein
LAKNLSLIRGFGVNKGMLLCICFIFMICFHSINAVESMKAQFITVRKLLKSKAETVTNPFHIRDAILPEWMMLNIKKELNSFEKFSSEELDSCYLEYEDRSLFYEGERSLVHYKIKNNILLVRGSNYSLKQALPITELIYKILNTGNLKIQNGDFLLDVDDTVDKKCSKYPILCLSKHKESNYICIPDWFAVTEAKRSLMHEIEIANKGFPWKKKINKAFWKGSPFGGSYQEDW